MVQEDSSSEEDTDEVTQLTSTINLLHAEGKAKILSVADKLSRNEVNNDIELVHVSDPVEIPVAESWDFCLGDRVRIKYSMRHFKHIQSNTFGWISSLRMNHSHVGVIIKCLSKYDAEITIHTESLFSDDFIYAGLLEKIPESENETSYSTQWRVNDHVMIESRKNDATVEILQGGLDDIPTRYFGRRGRVIAITKAATLVTFNERTSYKINHALLAKCSNQSPLIIPRRNHEKGFVIGQKVKVTDQIKKFVENQKSYRDGEWSDNMSKIIDKIVIIVHIHKDGGLTVRHKNGPSWLINQRSVTCLESSMSIANDDEEIFRRGDIVKVKSNDNIRTLMRANEIPTDFIEYLRLPANISLIDDDIDPLITFNGDRMIGVHSSSLSAATLEEQSRYKEIKSMTKEIAVGSSVRLDVGPINYVHAVLRDSSYGLDVIRVLTTRSTVVGIDNDGKAIIETGNGKRYRIGRKHLTVPDKFNF